MSRPEDLERIYVHRFDEHVDYRNDVWKVLTGRFFSRYIDSRATVMDLGCGYGEFINNIRCERKIAMDLNPRVKEFISSGVHFIEQDCASTWALPDERLDVVFTSNFFEHLPSKEALSATIGQAKRCLRSGGRLIAMGPNVKYVGGAYWDFWDHHLALSDVSLKELLSLQGFEIERTINRFLPYTMVNKRRSPILLVKSYLRCPLAWKIFGRQFLVIARKP